MSRRKPLKNLIKALRRRARPLLLAGIGTLIVVQVVALSPSSVEEAEDAATSVDPDALVPNESKTLATGIPKGKVPEYSVDGFNYVSSQGQEKQWKLVADKAFLYNHEKLVHTRKIQAFLYDPDGKITVVTGLEAKYFMNQRDLEVFGDVETTFPDGFKMKSQYLHYLAQQRRIEIPISQSVSGYGGVDKENPGQKFEFESQGMDFAMGPGVIKLMKNVRLTVDSPTKEKTRIDSDHCEIERGRQIARFSMRADRPVESRFVHITQPTMFARSRRAELNYGDYSRLLNYLVATEDVLIKKSRKGPDQPLKYATGGRADFDARRNVIVLTEYPQVYQDHDTVTGDTIVLHRDSDIVEVEHSNAFSQGQPRN